VSYILDALKKAERDRRLRRVPDLGTVHLPAAATRRRAWPWVAGGAAALNLVALGLLFRVTGGGPAVTAPPPAAPPASAPAASVSAVPASPVVTPAGARSPERVPDAEPMGPGRAGEHATAGGAAADASRMAPGGRRPRPDEPAPESAVRASAAERASAAADRPLPGAGDVHAGDASRHRAPHAEAMSAARAGNDLRLEVLVYADDPAERSAWINGRRYIEGQRVHGRFAVELITPDSVVLGGEGARVVLRQ
jgi:general secretion pathway protein B